MTDRHDDAVDVFLADLGAGQAPGDLTATVMRRVRDERPSRAFRVSPWLAVAAVLATSVLALTAVAWIVAGPGPSSAPLPVSPSVSPTASPSAPPTASPSAPPSTPSPGPTAAATWFDSWNITLAPDPQLTPVELMVLDYAGTMSGVTQATVALPWPGPGDPHALDIGPGSDASSITVGWVGGVCDTVARLELAPDGHTLSLRFPPRPACDLMGITFAAELRFKDPVDVAAFSGTWSEDMVVPSDVNARVVAFSDAQHGFVGGQTWGNALAIILETADGGGTWRVESLGGIGDVSAIGVTPDGRAWAGYSCAEELPGCRPGLYRYDEGLWGSVDDAWPVRLSFAGGVGAGLFRVPGGPVDDFGDPIAELRLMDEGEAWSTVASPCPTGSRTQDVSRIDGSSIVVMCASQGTDVISLQTLYRSTDGGVTWSKLADGPDGGTGMRMDVLPDGTGWMWGDRSPLLATIDGGLTWTARDWAGAGVRGVVDADALGGGLGFTLIRDDGREQTLLRRGEDGRPWTELSAFPIICCGG